jgi:Tfp pilus assembly protein FimT
MVIVVAVILLVLGIVLPAASTLWKQRRISEAQDTISGLLMTTRAKAMENDFGDSGLLFYLDDTGVQRIAAINQDAARAANPDTRETWANVFNILPERTYALPVPMRVVPRYTVYDPTTEPNPVKRFDTDNPDELSNNDFTTLPGGADQAQRHRNFFTMIYSSDGQLRVGREVLIRDIDDVDSQDEDDCPNNLKGDVSGLCLGDPAAVEEYYDPKTNQKKLIDVNPDPVTGFDQVDFLTVDQSSVALNFPSVDGLLVYDESLFAAAGDAAAKRKYLLESAQPFYVHRLTGAVIRGPVGEAVATAP